MSATAVPDLIPFTEEDFKYLDRMTKYENSLAQMMLDQDNPTKGIISVNLSFNELLAASQGDSQLDRSVASGRVIESDTPPTTSQAKAASEHQSEATALSSTQTIGRVITQAFEVFKSLHEPADTTMDESANQSGGPVLAHFPPALAKPAGAIRVVTYHQAIRKDDLSLFEDLVARSRLLSVAEEIFAMTIAESATANPLPQVAHSESTRSALLEHAWAEHPQLASEAKLMLDGWEGVLAEHREHPTKAAAKLHGKWTEEKTVEWVGRPEGLRTVQDWDTVLKRKDFDAKSLQTIVTAASLVTHAEEMVRNAGEAFMDGTFNLISARTATACLMSKDDKKMHDLFKQTLSRTLCNFQLELTSLDGAVRLAAIDVCVTICKLSPGVAEPEPVGDVGRGLQRSPKSPLCLVSSWLRMFPAVPDREAQKKSRRTIGRSLKAWLGAEFRWDREAFHDYLERKSGTVVA